MLRKLFKYEFKNTAKVMLTIYGILIVATLLGSLGLSTNALQTNTTELPPIIELLFFSAFMLYIFSIFALFVVTYVYVCIHFYKTMYSDQGYLTHTLPVKPLTLFNVKLATSWVWMMGSMILFYLSIFVVIIGATRGELFHEVVVGSDFALIQGEFASVFGMTLGQFIFLMFLLLMFSCLSYLLMVFVSISIGQLFNQHKIVGAIIAGIVIYFVEQTVGTIVLLLTGGSVFDNMDGIETFADMLTTPPMIGSAIVSVLFTVAFYITCIVIQKRHLNLD